MIRLVQPRHSPIRLLVALVAVMALLAACAPSSGPLGTPSTPTPSEDASVPVPSEDATPDLSSPTPAVTPNTGPSIAPSPGPSGEPSGTPPATPQPTVKPTATPQGTVIVRAYFVMGSFTANEGLVPVLREIPSTKAVATAAMRALLAGPNTAEMAGSPAMYTAIPANTTLLGLTIKDGQATVNLSQEFVSGGGSESMFQRLGQVVYTLTQFSTVKQVAILLDGVAATTFGGEGVTFTPQGRPIVRADFEDQLPAIFVDRPAWGASIGNPGTVSGTANVFEAVFRVAVLDASGATLVDKQVTASCGTGCRGDFRTTVSYTVKKAQWGTLRVYDLSAKDGTPENVTEYRVWLTPAG